MRHARMKLSSVYSVFVFLPVDVRCLLTRLGGGGWNNENKERIIRLGKKNYILYSICATTKPCIYNEVTYKRSGGGRLIRNGLVISNSWSATFIRFN
jgi:hypothetical protein